MTYLFEQSVEDDYEFFLADATDYFTPKTGISPTVTIRKSGGSFAAATNTPTEISGGWYKIVLTTTELNTLGSLIVHANGTACAEWREKCQVDTLERLLRDDAITADVMGAAALEAAAFAADFLTAAKIADDAITTDQLASTAVDAIVAGVWAALRASHNSVTGSFGKDFVVAGDAMDLVANAVDSTSVATDAITDAKIAAGAIGSSELSVAALQAIADYVWDELMAGHTTTDSAGKHLQDLGVASYPTASDVADEVWDRVLSGNHDITDSAGELLQDAGLTSSVSAIAAEVWQTALGSHSGVGGSTAEKLAALNSPASPQVPGSSQSGRLVATVGATYSYQYTGLTISATWNRYIFSVKSKATMDSQLDDDYALLYIVITTGGDAGDGLTYINGGVTDSAQQALASLTVNQGGGYVTIDIDEEIQQLISAGTHYYAIKEETAAGLETVRSHGEFVYELTAAKNAIA